MRRSPYRKVIHFAHAHELPNDLEVSQFVPLESARESAWVVWYRGQVIDRVGEVKPPDAKGFDWVVFMFWASYIAGVMSFIWWIINFFRSI